MKKLASAIAATAIAASLALGTTVSSSADVIYKVPTDPAEWSTWTSGLPSLDEATDISGEETADGALRVWFPETATSPIPNLLINSGSGLLAVSEGDKLHVDVTLEGETGATDMRWFLEIGFNGAGTDPARFNISKYIAEAANNGTAANDYGQLPSGTYNVVLDIADVIKSYDEDNGKANYDKIFGEGGNSYLTTININIATNDPEKNSDKDQSLIIREIAVGTSDEFANVNTGTSGGSTSTGGTTTNSSKGSTTTNSSKGSTTTNSSKGQVTTGENMLPIIGVAALAVVATSAVVVSKKRAK